MLFARSIRRALPRSPFFCAGPRRSFISDADVDSARAYCLNQIKTGDYDAHLVQHFLPPAVQDSYLALRTLNLELARLPEAVSHPSIAQMRMQFWHDSIDNIFDDQPPREPVSLLLYASLAGLAAREARSQGGVDRRGARGSSWSSLKFWLQRFISTRQQYMDNRPFASIAALEEYAENTYATLIYITLAMLPLRSMHVDHLASHIGKAYGIVAILRGVPVLARPAPTTSPSGQRNPVLLLPLDTMAEAGLREEDVYRQGPDAPGLKDTVFRVATRANDHLITAREMLKNIRAGRDVGHEYEHAGEAGHAYSDIEGSGAGVRVEIQALRRGFSVLLEAVPAHDFLTRLEAADFDPFRVKSSWKLPWSLYRAQRWKTL